MKPTKERLAELIERARLRSQQIQTEKEKESQSRSDSQPPIALSTFSSSSSSSSSETEKEEKTFKELFDERIEHEEALSRFCTDGNFEAPKHQPSEKDEQKQVQMVANPPVDSTNKIERTSAKVDVVLNADQQRSASLQLTGKSCVVIGAAGTGKTTSQRIIIQMQREAGKIFPFSRSTKYINEGLPAILVLSYTNKAVANIRRGLPKDITCLTVHKVLEYEPEFYDVMNAEGEMVKTMRFEPQRNAFNKLPPIALVIFEESSTISTHLHQRFLEALSNRPQMVYMGDIQQLPPVFGDAILGFKMLEHPVVELKTVMRQALESKILAFAWEILDGKPMSASYIEKKYNKEGEFKLRPWKKRLDAFDALHITTSLFCGFTDPKGVYHPGFLDSGEYNQFEDMILMPYAKRNTANSDKNWMCTDEVNKAIANKLGKMRKAVVYEVIAGYQKHYYAVGDKILVNKQEALITEIPLNGLYTGKPPISPSDRLNRYGHYELEKGEDAAALGLSTPSLSQEDIELMLVASSLDENVEERKNQASHVIHYKMLDSDETGMISTTGEFADCQFSYALTVHKAQGSEWKRVIILLHNSHDKMISRELLYTAVTRAREGLYIICEPDHFQKGIIRQRIKGDTLEEKAEQFKGKVLKGEFQLVEE